MGVELELWTREDGELGTLLPRAGEWDSDDGCFEFEGDGWLVSVFAPEAIEPGEVPAELEGLAEDLRYRVDMSVEPSAPGPGAWALVREAMESVGGTLGGVGLDPESGHARSWGS